MRNTWRVSERMMWASNTACMRCAQARGACWLGEQGPRPAEKGVRGTAELLVFKHQLCPRIPIHTVLPVSVGWEGMVGCLRLPGIRQTLRPRQRIMGRHSLGSHAREYH